MNWTPLNDQPQDDERKAIAASIQTQPALANLVRYERRGSLGLQLTGALPANEILFLDEPASPTPMPTRPPAASRSHRPSADVFYIGPE
jgi:hypothetical protein